jgi:hypothetical protein
MLRNWREGRGHDIKKGHPVAAAKSLGKGIGHAGKAVGEGTKVRSGKRHEQSRGKNVGRHCYNPEAINCFAGDSSTKPAPNPPRSPFLSQSVANQKGSSWSG